MDVQYIAGTDEDFVNSGTFDPFRGDEPLLVWFQDPTNNIIYPRVDVQAGQTVSTTVGLVATTAGPFCLWTADEDGRAIVGD